MRFRFEFKPQDCWIGVFWKKEKQAFGTYYDAWICMLPCFPLHIWWQKDEDYESFFGIDEDDLPPKIDIKDSSGFL